MTIAPNRTINTVDPSADELAALLDLQRSAHREQGPPSATLRRNRIDRLVLALLTHATELADAMDEDFGQRPRSLSLSVDVLGSLEDAEDIRVNLESWMADEPLDESGTAVIQHHPLGVVAVIGAWNFPVTLTVQPAFAALAAGNRVVIKMPSTSPRTGEVLRRAVAEQFDLSELAVVLGDGQVNDDFIALPFDHIMFTGSGRVGSIVATAAAKNLVPVTLELGGKNPAVVDLEADLDIAADRVAVSRMANGGQICMCADYVLVHNDVKDTFVDKLVERLRGYFPTYADNSTVVSLGNDAAYDRVTGLVEDAVARGARKMEIIAPEEEGRLPDPVKRLVPPTVLLDVPAGAMINHEEIFGPVLPVYGYDSLDQAIDYVNDRPAPLAAYWYGPDNEAQSRFIAQTTSGGVTRNDGFLHASYPGAPFGGVGASGHGAYHGKAGFDTFTHRRPLVSADDDHSSMGALVGPALAAPQMEDALAQAIAGALANTRFRLREYDGA